MFGLRIWKIVSGILSIILCFVVSYQTVFVQIGVAIFGMGWSSMFAGSFVSIMLLVGGIVSLVTNKGSNGGDIALVVIFLLAAVIGFLFAGAYGDLILWSIWCLICMFVALFSFALRQVDRGSYKPEKPVPAVPQQPQKPSMSEPLKKAVLEKNPKKQEAMVDGMSEEEAKTSLKYILRVITKKRT